MAGGVKRVFFFGAGFSKALNPAYPTLIDLTRQVHESFCSRYPDGSLRAHYDQLAEPIRADIEQLLSYLATQWPWKTSIDDGLDSALFNALAFEVASGIRRIKSCEINGEYIRLIRYLNEHAFGIVSLNYDTLFEDLSKAHVLPKRDIYSALEIVIEDSFDHVRRTSSVAPYVIEPLDSPYHSNGQTIRSRLTISRGFIDSASPDEFTALVSNTHAATWTSWTPERVLEKLRGYGNPELAKYRGGTVVKPLKLHGSIDWTQDNSQAIPITTGLQGKIKERLPLIVPPIADKSQYYEVSLLRDLWFEAHSKLEQADEVVVVGFSLPLTDISVRYLFQSALRNNSTVKIVVVNRDNSERLQARYEAVFSQQMRAGNLDIQFIGQETALLDYARKEIPS